MTTIRRGRILKDEKSEGGKKQPRCTGGIPDYRDFICKATPGRTSVFNPRGWL